MSPSAASFPRQLYRNSVFLFNSFRARWNRRTRRSVLSASGSRLRSSSSQWLKLFDSHLSRSRATCKAAHLLHRNCLTLLGKGVHEPSRPRGYLRPHFPRAPVVYLKKCLALWISFRSEIFAYYRKLLSKHSALPKNYLPAAKPINILVWNVGADINAEPQHSIIVETLKRHAIHIACLQEFRNNDILLPLHKLRPVSVWPSLLTHIGDNRIPHVFGGSLIASQLGYLSRDTTVFDGSIEFNSVCVTPDFHIINVYLPFAHTELRSRTVYDDSYFLSHIRSLSSDPERSLLIVGDFNVPLSSLGHLSSKDGQSRRSQTLMSLLEEGFEIKNPVNSDGLFLPTHHHASSRTSSCIDIVLWKGFTGLRHRVRAIVVERLLLNCNDHYGLIVKISGTFPRPKRSNLPPSAFIDFANCLESCPPTLNPDTVLSCADFDVKSAHDLWSSVSSSGCSEKGIVEVVAAWLKVKNQRESLADPLLSAYFSLCRDVVSTRENLRRQTTCSHYLFNLLCSNLRNLLDKQRKLRCDITRRALLRQTTRLSEGSILSGDDSVIRRFLLKSLHSPGKCLDLSSLSTEDFERFRAYYSECWDPPDSLPPDLSFLDSPVDPALLLPNAIPHDISGEVTVEELTKALLTLRRRKAPGPSGVPVDFYKISESNPDVSDFLVSLVNQCLAGNRPSCLDSCKLILLYKKGARSDPANWRPINLTNAAFRVCEAVIHLRLLDWSERILGTNAFGFRRGRRAEDVSYLLAHNLERANRLRRPIHVVSLDIAKAFDTVPHDQLLLSLVRVGLSTASVKIVSSMLLGHTSVVGDPTNPRRHFTVNICRGVLQGGILSPLLFNIFFDQGLLSSVPGILPLSYADDVSAIHLGPLPPRKHASAHHRALQQQRTAIRTGGAFLHLSSDSDDDTDDTLSLDLRRRTLLLAEDDEQIPSNAAARDLKCRDQVNAWLHERDIWLQSRCMTHNASKSESIVLHCNHASLPPLHLISGQIPVRAHSITVLGSEPLVSGFCSRANSSHNGKRAAALFNSAWVKLRKHVNLNELRCLLMAFVYSHTVFGTCLQDFSGTRASATSPMTSCLRFAVHAHPSVHNASLYEFFGMIAPLCRTISLRLGFLLRCLDPSSPILIRNEFLNNRMSSPWFRACMSSFSRLPQPKSGLSLNDRLDDCISTIELPDLELPDSFTHPPPNDLHAAFTNRGYPARHTCAPW